MYPHRGFNKFTQESKTVKNSGRSTLRCRHPRSNGLSSASDFYFKILLGGLCVCYIRASQMLQWGAYREGKCDVSKIQICEYGICLHIQKGFIRSHWSKTVLISPPHNNFTVKMLVLGHLGFFFVLSGNASLSHNFTNLVFVTSSLSFSIQ